MERDHRHQQDSYHQGLRYRRPRPVSPVHRQLQERRGRRTKQQKELQLQLHAQLHGQGMTNEGIDDLMFYGLTINSNLCNQLIDNESKRMADMPKLIARAQGGAMDVKELENLPHLYIGKNNLATRFKI